MAGYVTEEQSAMGTLIGGRYRVERLLGEGGFASVYLARHAELDTQVALKRMHAQHLTRDDLQARFRAEAKTAARLESRHTVRVRDFGFDDDGAPYMVMDLVRGPTLERLLQEHGRLPPETAARVALGVLASLAEAAEHGVIHRDIKPANVFVAEDRESAALVAKVGDFGIAKLINAREVDATRTIDGVLCTPQYAAPELLHRAPCLASDLYSLGHMLAELIDGRPPYDGDNGLVVATRHLSPEVVPLGPEARASFLAPVIEKAVAKPVEDRYGSAREMSAAIAGALRAAGLSADATIDPGALSGPPREGGRLFRPTPTTGSGARGEGVPARLGTATLPSRAPSGTSIDTVALARGRRGRIWKPLGAVALLGGLSVLAWWTVGSSGSGSAVDDSALLGGPDAAGGAPDVGVTAAGPATEPAGAAATHAEPDASLTAGGSPPDVAASLDVAPDAAPPAPALMSDTGNAAAAAPDAGSPVSAPRPRRQPRPSSPGRPGAEVTGTTAGGGAAEPPSVPTEPPPAAETRPRVRIAEPLTLPGSQ